MYLTKQEERMLNGENGYAIQKSMEILVSLGKIYGAENLIGVSSVQVAGVSYHNLGDAGLEFIESLSKDGKVKVLTTLNPAGMDLDNWEKMGIDKEFAEKQKKVINAFRNIGIIISCSCTPYLIGNNPLFGEHIAWSESSAVCFANSVLGAMTNREGGPSALASALTGKTAAYGLHLKENRNAAVKIKVESEIDSLSDYGALGVAIGKKIKNSVPYITGIKNTSLEKLKSFAASIATYGGTAIFHIENITPSTTTIPSETVVIEDKDIKEARNFLNDGAEPDFVSVGCPHCSLNEMKEIADFLKGKKTKKELWIITSKQIKNMADNAGYTKIIEETGSKVFCDTCMAVAPLKGRFKCMLTNSAKACFYGRGSNGFKTKFADLEECIKESVK
jgi:predicted aconitase